MSVLTQSSTGPYLTGRERQVALLLANGHSRKSIAQELMIDVQTVEVHLKNIAEKVPGNGKRCLRVARFALVALSTAA